MKILQVVQKPQRRGAEVFAGQLSRQLTGMGHESRTVYLYPHEDEDALPLAPADTVLSGRERHPFERIPGVHPLLLWRLRRVIDRMRPDVVQANGGRTVKYSAAAAAGLPGRAWVLIYRNIGHVSDWGDRRRRAIYARLIMPRVDGVVGVSGATLDTVQALYHLSVPTTRIPCAVDAEAFAPATDRTAIRRQTATPLDAPVIVWVGSLSREKRVDRLIRAAEVIRRSVPDVHLWIVGGGPLRGPIEAGVRASALASRVRFIGVQDRVADFMNAGDLVALTSDTEGMPAVLLEAGLLGRAVVATRVGGVPECVRDGQTGLLVDPDDEAGLADACRDLLQHPERRDRMGRAAKAWIESHFTAGRIARQYAAFYEQVLAG